MAGGNPIFGGSLRYHCAINAENSSSFSIDDDDDHDAGAVLIVAVDADAYVARG